MRPRILLTVAVLLLTAASWARPVSVDTQRSRLTVHALKAGVFGGFGHDHEIVAPVTSGTIDVQNQTIELRFDSRQMRVLDPELEPDKRMEVQQTMLSEKVLDPARFPDIHFISRRVTSSDGHTYRVEGSLTLHGITRPIVIPVALAGNSYGGSVKLKQSEFGIKPVRVFGGTVKVKDEVEITFEIVPAAGPLKADSVPGGSRLNAAPRKTQ